MSTNEIAGPLQVISTKDGPVGNLALPSGLTQKPCFTCCDFDKDEKKLRQHLTANGLQPDVNGVYTTPIVQDFDNRASLQIDPRDFGFCKDQSMPTHMNCTCEHWKPTTRITDMRGKVQR
jgi:hypothetical protein